MSRLGLTAITATLVGIVGLIALLATVLAVFAYTQLGRNQVTNCQQIEVVKTGLRETLQEAENFVTSSPVRSAVEKRQAIEFYGDALGRLKPRHC